MNKYTNEDILQFARKLADTCHRVVNSKAKTISLAIEIMNSALEEYDNSILSCIEKTEELQDCADWLIWAGWMGNHDRRIDDAKCSKCGYIHHTVFGSVEKLSKHCLSCRSNMSIQEQG